MINLAILMHFSQRIKSKNDCFHYEYSTSWYQIENAYRDNNFGRILKFLIQLNFQVKEMSQQVKKREKTIVYSI